jgi:hypothetical protein
MVTTSCREDAQQNYCADAFCCSEDCVIGFEVGLPELVGALPIDAERGTTEHLLWNSALIFSSSAIFSSDSRLTLTVEPLPFDAASTRSTIPSRRSVSIRADRTVQAGFVAGFAGNDDVVAPLPNNVSFAHAAKVRAAPIVRENVMARIIASALSNPEWL